MSTEVRSTPDRQAGHHHAGTAGPVEEEPLPLLVLPARRAHLLRLLCRPDVLVVLLRLTRWTLFDFEFIGLDNFVAFFPESALLSGLRNTLIYAVVTCGLKVVLGMRWRCC